jgi:hypothetical protein
LATLKEKNTTRRTSFLRTRKRPPFIPVLKILKLVPGALNDDAAEARVDARGRFRLDVVVR